MLCRNAELLLQDAERNAQVLVAKLEAVTGGLPFKLPPRRHPAEQQQEDAGGAIVVANEIITESLVDFTSVEVRAGGPSCMYLTFMYMLVLQLTAHISNGSCAT